jgi:phosphoribosylanthranilate isomerase
MSFIVKICGVTSTKDATLAVEAGANAIGLNFYLRSPRAISITTARHIVSKLPDTVLKVGVFVEPSAEDLQRAIDEVPLDVVQLHGERVSAVAHRTWRALSPSSDPSESLVAEAILLDTFTPNYGGSGEVFDWKLATRFWQPIIIAGGLDASNVANAIEIARPWGVDACSRLESAPGIKDPIRVRDFVQAAFAAAESLDKVAP